MQNTRLFAVLHTRDVEGVSANLCLTLLSSPPSHGVAVSPPLCRAHLRFNHICDEQSVPREETHVVPSFGSSCRRRQMAHSAAGNLPATNDAYGNSTDAVHL